MSAVEPQSAEEKAESKTDLCERANDRHCEQSGKGQKGAEEKGKERATADFERG